MVCEHLAPVEAELKARGARETFRGQAWSDNCREWVYFDCVLDRAELRRYFALAPCVVDHDHLGTHDGQESGLVCTEHHDGVMGRHPAAL